MALGGLLSLKWNNHCSTFLHILSNLHKKNSYDDATVACDGKLYPVHKLVLSTCSDYFQEMFEKTHGKHPVIVLKDIKSEVFEALLKYMYIGEVNVIQEKLSELINAAECLKIKGLAAPDEEPEQSSHSSRSGHSSSGKRKQDQYSSDSSAPPTKLHRSSSHSNAESTKNTSHAISNSSSNSSDLNKNRSNANYNHSTSKSSYQDKSIASSSNNNNNNNVDSSRRRRSDGSSHRSGSLSRENLSSVQDDDIEEIPASVVKQEPVDLGDEPVEEVSARGREGAEGGEDDSVGERAGDVPADLDQPEEQDSKYGILDEDDSGGDRDQWESNLMTKEDEDVEAFSSMLGGDSKTGEAGIEGGPSSSGQGMAQEDDSAAGVWAANELFLQWQQQPSPQHHHLPQQHLHRNKPTSTSHQDNNNDDDGGDDAAANESSSPGGGASFSGGGHLSRTDQLSALQGLFSNSHHRLLNYSPEVVSASPDSVHGPLPGTSGPSSQVPYAERPYPCPYCTYRATVKGNLAMHMRTHTGEKPFKCQQCNYSSAFLQNVHRHVKTTHPQQLPQQQLQQQQQQQQQQSPQQQQQQQQQQ